jgi:hypothetical protein
MDSLKVLVIARPEASWLAPLGGLPESAALHIGNTDEFLKAEAPDADIILNSDSSGAGLRVAWPMAKTRSFQRLRQVPYL